MSAKCEIKSLGEKCYDLLTCRTRIHLRVCSRWTDVCPSQLRGVRTLSTTPSNRLNLALQSPSLRFAITQTTNTCFLSANRCSSSGAAALASHWCALRACPGSKRAKHSTSWLNFNISESGDVKLIFFSTHRLYLHFEEGGKNYFQNDINFSTSLTI
jgi:hypothetical protein